MIQGIRLNVQVQNLWYWAANRDNFRPRSMERQQPFTLTRLSPPGKCDIRFIS